jgi:diguanylate cyclase (GGDEF)-like protein
VTWWRELSSVQDKAFDLIMDYAAMPVAILDAQLRFVKVNPAMALRLPPEARLGKPLGEVLPNLSKRIRPFLLKVLKTGEPAVTTIGGELSAGSGVPGLGLAACFPCGESRVIIMALQATQRTAVEALQRSNELLATALADLKRNDLVHEMAHSFLAAMTVDDLYRIVSRFMPQLFAGTSGALCVIDSSRSAVEATATWGDCFCVPRFSPDDCWALRGGRTHLVGDPEAELVCPHAGRGGQYGQVCVPMMARSEILGFLHLQSGDPASAPFTPSQLHLIHVVTKEVALSLANVGLREVLREQAFRDSLTGLYNRRFLQEALDIELSQARRKQWPVALVMIDVDGFKAFNDTYGHPAGDALLRAMAASLQSSIRSNDVLGRYGGDEFSLVMPEASLQDATKWAEKWRSATNHFNIEWEGKALPWPTVSMGVAAYPNCRTSDSLFREADAALYAAKVGGRNQVKSNIFMFRSKDEHQYEG